MNTDPVSTHLSIKDITDLEPPGGLMKFYKSVPWLHLNDARDITRNTIQYSIRLLEHREGTYNLGRSYYVRYLNSGITEFYEKSNTEISYDTLARLTDAFSAPFVRNDDSKEGNIEVVGYVETPAEDQHKQNDTTRIILNFKDYYAYDDGTPNMGLAFPDLLPKEPTWLVVSGFTHPIR